MRSIGFTTPGGPEQLEVLDRPGPEPGPGEVRIRARAASVNPTDTALRAGLMLPDDVEPPYVPGMDVAGEIDAVGPDVEWAVGDRVAAVVNPRRPAGGAYAEQVVVPAESVARVPDGVDLIEAATLPLNGLTAYRALELLRLPDYGTVAVTGAAGGVGGFAIQLAVHRGNRVVADAASDDLDLVTGLGAHTVLHRGPDLGRRVHDAEPGGVDGLIDAAVIGAEVLPAVRDGGVIAAVRPFDGEPERDISIYVVSPADYLRHGDWLAEMFELVERRALTLRVAETFPADRAAEAHRALEAGGVRGRLVLTF